VKAVVLAAGRGSRLQQVTASRPKALVELAGRTILDWTLAALAASGIDDVLVVRGYRGEALSGRYATVDNASWDRSNMVVSLLCADTWLRSDSCIVSYADIVYHPRHLQALAAAEGAIAVTYDRSWWQLWSERFADPLADAETFRAVDGYLVEIGGRAADPSEIAGQYMGLLKITPAGWQSMRALIDTLPPETVDRLDMTALLRRLVHEGQRIRAVPVDGRWCEVDSVADLRLYERRLAEADATRAAWTHDWR
jgi:choline kinase